MESNELADFVAWIHDTTTVVRDVMQEIHDQWEPATMSEILMIVTHDHFRTMYDNSYTPYAAAVWVTDCSPVAHHFVDCKDRQRREHLAKRRTRFTNNRRSWRRG